MKRIVVPVMMLLVSILHSAQAQGSKKATPWAQEPETVLGFRLGETLANAGIPACPLKEPYMSKTVCYAVSQTTIPSIDVFGHGIQHVRVTLNVTDQVLTQIIFQLDHLWYDQIKETLITRYGAPTETTDSAVQNMSGATFSNRRMTWAGQRTTVLSVERFGKVDDSIVIFSDNAAQGRAAESQRQQTKGNASKL